MLHRVTHFLQAIFRDEQSTGLSSTEQPMQQVAVAREQDTSAQRISSAIKKELVDKDTLPTLPAVVRERTTEPYRTLMRKKNPAQRYRKLDAMLEQFKRERLQTMNTQLVPRAAYKPVRRLQRIIEQQEER